MSTCDFISDFLLLHSNFLIATSSFHYEFDFFLNELDFCLNELDSACMNIKQEQGRLENDLPEEAMVVNGSEQGKLENDGSDFERGLEEFMRD